METFRDLLMYIAHNFSTSTHKKCCDNVKHVYVILRKEQSEERRQGVEEDGGGYNISSTSAGALIVDPIVFNGQWVRDQQG